MTPPPPRPFATQLPLRTEPKNANGFWQVHAAKAKKQRNGVAIAIETRLRFHGLTCFGPKRKVGWIESMIYLRAPVVVRMTRLSRGELQDDNLRSALKHVRDGIADAMGVDDADPRVTWRYAQGRSSKEMPYAVRIEVWERALEQERPRAGTDG